MFFEDLDIKKVVELLNELEKKGILKKNEEFAKMYFENVHKVIEYNTAISSVKEHKKKLDDVKKKINDVKKSMV